MYWLMVEAQKYDLSISPLSVSLKPLISQLNSAYTEGESMGTE